MLASDCNTPFEFANTRSTPFPRRAANAAQQAQPAQQHDAQPQHNSTTNSSTPNITTPTTTPTITAILTLDDDVDDDPPSAGPMRPVDEEEMWDEDELGWLLDEEEEEADEKGEEVRVAAVDEEDDDEDVREMEMVAVEDEDEDEEGMGHVGFSVPLLADGQIHTEGTVLLCREPICSVTSSHLPRYMSCGHRGGAANATYSVVLLYTTTGWNALDPANVKLNEHDGFVPTTTSVFSESN